MPFYNGVPEIPAWSWIILLAGVIAYIMLVMHIPVELNYNIFPIALMLSTTLPILIVARVNYGYFFKKISMGDVKYIILTVILSFIYSIVFGAIFYMTEGMPQNMLQLMGYEISIRYTIEIILPLFIQLMGEELFKVIIILINFQKTVRHPWPFQYLLHLCYSGSCMQVNTAHSFALL